jgi:hypothetical protein
MRDWGHDTDLSLQGMGFGLTTTLCELEIGTVSPDLPENRLTFRTLAAHTARLRRDSGGACNELGSLLPGVAKHAFRGEL